VETITVESIELTLPLSPRHAATARVVAASLAADAGFTVDEIDDFRLGINEAVAVLTEDADDTAVRESTRRLSVMFRVSDRRVDVVVRRDGGDPAGPPDELAERILSAVVDHHEYIDGAFHLTKSTIGSSVAPDAD
jgi:anti-sigma regulatory factor (Ser/Thr protein kinase)